MPYLLKNQNLYSSCTTFICLGFLHEKCISFKPFVLLEMMVFQRCLLWRYQPAWMNAKTQQSSIDVVSSKFKGTAVSKVANLSPGSILFYSGPADTRSCWLVGFADPFQVLVFQAVFSSCFSLHQMYQKICSLSITKSFSRWQEQVKITVLMRGRGRL